MTEKNSGDRRAAIVRLVAPGDREALADLLQEMERHYERDQAASVDAALAALDRLVFVEPPVIEVMVAELGGRLAGLATLSLVFPAQRFGTGLFVKDLYVAAAARQNGVGHALLRGVARLAVARGCQRVDWGAVGDNRAALALYDAVGARALPGALYLRLDGPALERLAAVSR